MSQALELSLTCPQCGTEFSAEAHTIVDMANEADSEALWQLQNGTLNKIECPNCKTTGIIPVPLLLNSPEKELLVVFAPGATQMDEMQLSELISPVLQPYLSNLPEDKQADYMFKPVITDDPTVLQKAALGEINSDDIMGDASEYDEDDEGDFADGEGGEPELSAEEQKDLTERMGLLQQLFQASDSLERISLMRAHAAIVDDLYLEVIGLITDQAQAAQPELIPTLQKMMNEAEVFIASNKL